MSLKVSEKVSVFVTGIKDDGEFSSGHTLCLTYDHGYYKKVKT